MRVGALERPMEFHFKLNISAGVLTSLEIYRLIARSLQKGEARGSIPLHATYKYCLRAT